MTDSREENQVEKRIEQAKDSINELDNIFDNIERVGYFSRRTASAAFGAAAGGVIGILAVLGMNLGFELHVENNSNVEISESIETLERYQDLLVGGIALAGASACALLIKESSEEKARRLEQAAKRLGDHPSMSGFKKNLEDEHKMVTRAEATKIAAKLDGEDHQPLSLPSATQPEITLKTNQPTSEPQEVRIQSSEQQEIRAGNEVQERVIDRTGENQLQIYFDQITDLLINKRLISIAAKEESNLQDQEVMDAALDVIRDKTLVVLRDFENDTHKKSSIIRFLAEVEIFSKLKLNFSNDDLREINLEKVDLHGINLNGINLSKANLVGAILSNVNLMEASLQGANLKNANLQGANLENANLQGANLENAILWGADLEGVIYLTEAQLARAKLCFTKLPDNMGLNPNRNCKELGIISSETDNSL